MNEDIVLNSIIFRNWKNKIERSGVSIHSLKILSIVSRNSKSFYLALLDFIMLTPEGDKLPRCIVLRGDTVVIVPLIRCIDKKKIFTLMVQQRRVIDGCNSLEFPAGMVDNNLSDPVLSAVKEVKEELGMNVNVKSMRLLTNEPLNVCESLMDEHVNIYSFTKEMTYESLVKFDNKSSGVVEDGELITIKLISIEKAKKIPSFSTNVALNLINHNDLIF